jgi:hypothetical protein
MEITMIVTSMVLAILAQAAPAAPAKAELAKVAGRAVNERINRKVLFAGNPGSERQRDFTALLETHFAEVGTADFTKLRDADAAGYDVVILDCDQSMMAVVQEGDRLRDRLPPMPRLSRDFDRPVVLIGPMGGMVAKELDLKLKWLCNCLDDAAQELVVAHPIFHEPLAVSIRLEESPTPDRYRNPWWPGGRALAPTIKTWQVQTKTYRNRREGKWEVDPGLVCEPYGFTDSPDCEVIAAGRNAKMYEAIAIGRQANFLMWGFYAPPSGLTPEARKCLVNAIAYIARFDHQKPLVRRVTSDRKQWLTYTNIPDFIRDEAIYKTMFPAHLRVKFGEVVEKYAAYYRENLEYLHPTGTDHVVDVDEDVKALGVSNRKVELLETCIAMLERSDRPELALRVLKRYTTEDFAEARQWRSWLTAHRGRLFFTDAGGFKFLVAPGEPGRSSDAGPHRSAPSRAMGVPRPAGREDQKTPS